MGYQPSDPDQVHVAGKGVRVARAAANLPQTTSETLFTITGGLVAVRSIIGVVTTAIQNQANNTKLTYTPDGGSPADITAALNVANDQPGEIWSIDNSTSDPLRSGTGRIESGQQGTSEWLFHTGTIDLDCAASNTGQARWVLFYYALDDGARVTAA